METPSPKQQQFESDQKRFYERLKESYSRQQEKAKDKDYARQFFIRTLLVENKLLPKHSLFFETLKFTFEHFDKLGFDDALQLTLDELDTIREQTENVLHQDFALYHTGLEQMERLNWVYLNAMEQGGISILSLFDQDTRLMKKSVGSLITLLAAYQATQQLINELSAVPQMETETVEQLGQLIRANQSNESAFLTRSQQVLVFYYLIQLLGKRADRNVSKKAESLHLFLGLPFSQITHSELYKKMLHPLSFSSKSATIKNLQTVRVFFEKLGVDEAFQLIDKDCEQLKKEIEKKSR